MKRRSLPALLAFAVAATMLAGCREDMAKQPKLKTYTTAQAFAEDAEARSVPTGTVARDALARFAAQARPPKVDAVLIARGKERFDIYCSMCHGLSGRGDGIVVERGFPPPPSYGEKRLLAADPAHFYDVITHGWGVMYSYANRVTPHDRWAIVAYIRALQLAQTGVMTADAAAPRETAGGRP